MMLRRKAGKYGGAGATTVVVSVAASTDDAERSAGATDVTAQFANIFGNEYLGLRFNGLSALAGTTIISAEILFQARGDATGTPYTMDIRCFDEDDTATFSTGEDFSARAVTASVPWTIPAWTDGASGADQTTPDLASIVQTVVNRVGFVSNIGFRLERTSPSNFRGFALFDHPTFAPAQLTVDYQ